MLKLGLSCSLAVTWCRPHASTDTFPARSARWRTGQVGQSASRPSCPHLSGCIFGKKQKTKQQPTISGGATTEDIQQPSPLNSWFYHPLLLCLPPVQVFFVKYSSQLEKKHRSRQCYGSLTHFGGSTYVITKFSAMLWLFVHIFKKNAC